MKEIIESQFDPTQYDIAVVDFWADWCQPCHMMMPTFMKIAKEMHDMHFFKANIEENTELCKKLKISSVPTIAIFKNGALLSMHPGLQSEARLREVITRAKQ